MSALPLYDRPLAADRETTCREALHNVQCCQPASVGQLGLASHVTVENDTAHVRVLPCCVFGITRLVSAVEDGLRGVEGIRHVDVTVGWKNLDLSRNGHALVQLDLRGWAQQAGLQPWGAKGRVE